MRFAVKNAAKRRKGVTIVESVILMIVLMLTFGAVFATLGWGQVTHIHSRNSRESMEVLFSFVQAFDAMFQPVGHEEPVVDLVNRADGAFAGAAIALGGTFIGTAPLRAQVRSFSIEATPQPGPNRSLQLVINVRSGGSTWVNQMTRTFSGFTNDVVEGWRE